MDSNDNGGTSGGVTRRSFLVGGAAAVAAGAALRCLPGVEGEWKAGGGKICAWTEPSVAMSYPAQAGRVLEVDSPALVTGTPPKVVETEAASAIKKLLLALTGAASLPAAWGQILTGWKAEHVVGIKVNVLSKRVPTHKEAVRALVQLLRDHAGVAADNILVWDRRLDELTAAGFTEAYLGCRVEGTQDDAKAKGASRGYELGPTCIGGQNTHLSNIQTRAIDHLINFSVMKNHKASGFTGCMKNHYGTIDNPGEYHDQTGEGGVVLERRFVKAIPAINALDEVAGKSRLWLMDATIGVCKGDTDSDADCLPYRMLAGLDPVAIDSRGRALRDVMAQGATQDSISGGWFDAAERVGLGKQAVKLETVT